MEKYFVTMKNENGKETVTTSWQLSAIEDFIKFNEKLGYKVTSRG